MKIALIQPVTGTESTKVVRVVREPLGLLHIAAALNEKAYLPEVKTVDYSAKIFHPIERVEPRAVVPWEDAVLISRLKEFAPQAIGISTMTYNFERGIEIAQQIKGTLGDIPIIFGGYHVSGCAKQYLKWKSQPDNNIFLEDLENVFKTKCVDFVVIGEGEKTIIELLECIKQRGNLHEIAGIAFAEGGKIVISQRDRLKDLDALPIPDRSQLDWTKYKSSVKGDNVATIHTARGCRYSCYYCSTPTTWGNGISKRSSQNVVDEIEYLVKIFSVGRITFADEDFLSDFERIHDICDEIKRRNIKVKWDSFASIGDILRDDSEELLQNMKEAGCVSFFVGIESLNMDTLIDYNRPQVKRYSISEYLIRVQKAINIVSAAGIDFYGDYMMGYPKETEENLINGFERLKGLRNMPYIYLPILAAFPGTHLYEESKQKGWFLPEKSFKNFDCSQQVLKCDSERVAELRDQFEIEFYTNKNYVKDFVASVKAKPERFDQVLQLYVKLSQDYPDNSDLLAIKGKIESVRERARHSELALGLSDLIDDLLK